MKKAALYLVSIATLISTSYFSLIAFDIWEMVIKNWRHDEYLYIQLSTIVSVFVFLLGSLFVSFFQNKREKIILTSINSILLITWCAMIALGAIGVIS